MPFVILKPYIIRLCLLRTMYMSDFCKQDLRKLKYDKKYETVKAYFDPPDKLVNAIKLYHQKQQTKDQYSLLDLLK